MEPLKSFKDLIVWQKAHQLALNIYKSTKNFPRDEQFGLTAQLRRAGSSVATNIVEGFKRMSKKDQAHFINIAEGSLEETKYHFILCRDLNYLSPIRYQQLMDQAEEIGRMLNAYRRSIIRTVIDTIIPVFFLVLISYSLVLFVHREIIS